MTVLLPASSSLQAQAVACGCGPVANALQTAHAYNMTMTGYGPVDNEVSEETIEASSVDYMCVPSLPCRLVSKVASRNRKGLIREWGWMAVSRARRHWLRCSRARAHPSARVAAGVAVYAEKLNVA